MTRQSSGSMAVVSHGATRAGSTPPAAAPVGERPASLDLNCAAENARLVGKGKIMTDKSGFEDAPDKARAEQRPEEPDLRGRYVEGDFGKAGRQPGRHPDDEEGQYVEGEYGSAGSEGGLPEPLGEKARESGRYVRADYGDAGSTPGRTAESEVGGYAEGNYGKGGTVKPVRSSRDDAGTGEQK